MVCIFIFYRLPIANFPKWIPLKVFALLIKKIIIRKGILPWCIKDNIYWLPISWPVLFALVWLDFFIISLLKVQNNIHIIYLLCTVVFVSVITSPKCMPLFGLRWNNTTRYYCFSTKIFLILFFCTRVEPAKSWSDLQTENLWCCRVLHKVDKIVHDRYLLRIGR